MPIKVSELRKQLSEAERKLALQEERLSVMADAIEQLKLVLEAQREWIRVRQLSDTGTGIALIAENAAAQRRLGVPPS